ncbi:MAG TPA: adenylate/guanylate cyclase domain-containing protein, partial [Candidatus Binatia bacterium]|nr:adenylate/guanylate cyclase domain-containing protein [Candidatus Binatia bacterium]
MTCPTCGSANPLGAKFCNECATRLTLTCPSCGAANPPTAKFCSECATNLVATSIEGPATAPIAQVPGGAGPPTGLATGGPVAERRLVSVLFADLVGFTPFAEERDPEAVRETLSAYYEGARAAVERHGGVIEKFIGDAVMAVWGTPVAHEDDAERAVRAALEIVDDAPQLGSGIEARA